MTKGVNILRLFIENGEFNFGKLTFTYKNALSFVPPIANAGDDISVISPNATATLDGSLSNDPEGQTITYNWEQIYGPSTIAFNTTTIASPQISNLEDGVYKCKLTVSDGTYSDFDEVLIIVSATGNLAPSISITSPKENASFKEGETINITTNSSDFDGTVTLVEFFDGTTKIGESSASPFSFSWSAATVGNHVIKAKATDNDDATSDSNPISISVSEVISCTDGSLEATEGNFSIGYSVNYENVGTNVTFTFELLDTNRTGVIAYLKEKNSGTEIQMDQLSGLKFKKSITSLTNGQTISYACKLVYAGGFSTTKYFDYVVGNACGNTSDKEAPTNFTATLGTISERSVEVLVNASDNSGNLIYTATYGSNSVSINGNSGVQKSFVINNLNPNTAYTFNIVAKDLSGNQASNNPIVINATTAADTNSDCSGTDSEANQGSFSTGYTYSFETIGTSVKFIFEMLDTDKSDVNGYLWRQTPSPFSETSMTKISDQKFTTTVTGFTNGQTISYACKFSFAGGLAVTKYLSYTVGETCALSIEKNSLETTVTLFPNPAKNILNITSQTSEITRVEIYSVIGKKLIEFNSNLHKLAIDELSRGLYLIKIYADKNSFTTKFIKE